MKKLTQFLFLFSALLGFLASCSGDYLETPTLSIPSDMNILKPSKEGQEYTIAISSNQVGWKASCNAEWINLRQMGNNLSIEVLANKEKTERAAQVLLAAGSKLAQINVLQMGDKTKYIELEYSKRVFTRHSDKVHIPIKSDDDQWTVDVPTDASWLSVTARPKYNEIIVELTSNSDKDTRSCELTFRNGDAEKTLLIEQEGKLHFILPFLKWGGDMDEIENLEKARESTLAIRPTPGNPIMGIPESKDYTYKTISAAFPFVKYECLNFGSKFMYKATLLVDNLRLLDDPEFLKFIEDAGFVKKTDQGKGLNEISTYENKEKSTNLVIFKSKKGGVAGLTFYPQIEQEKDYEMPDNFSLGFPFSTDKYMDEVDEWEKQHNGEFDEYITKNLFQEAKKYYHSPKPHFAHIYTPDDLYGINLKSMSVLLDNEYTYVYSFGGISFVTKEFDAKLKGLGYEFTFYDYDKNLTYYRNYDENINLEIGLTRINRTMMVNCKLSPIR